jgi:hypothetical protein
MRFEPKKHFLAKLWGKLLMKKNFFMFTKIEKQKLALNFQFCTSLIPPSTTYCKY